MRGGSWGEIVDRYRDVEEREDAHGYVAPARQPCPGSRRATRERPEVCPTCDKKVNYTTVRLGGCVPGTNERITEYVLDSHTAAPAPVAERSQPKTGRAVDA